MGTKYLILMGPFFQLIIYKCLAEVEIKRKTNGDRHGKSSPAPECMVLPPGELNGIIPEPLPIYTESFMAISVNVFLSMLRVNKDTRATKKTLLYNTVIINYFNY